LAFVGKQTKPVIGKDELLFWTDAKLIGVKPKDIAKGDA